MKSRRGVSLVELLLTMSACTVILTMSAALTHRVMHTQSRMRAFHDTERSALRLASAFRRDVHQAASAVTNDGELAGNFLRLQLPEGETIEYRHEQGSVTRVHKQSSNLTAHEAYIFPAEVELTVRREAANRIVLTIVPALRSEDSEAGSPSMTHTTPAHLQVEATLSRDATAGREGSR
jgi:hypothetical protein